MHNEYTDPLFSLLNDIDFTDRASVAQRNYVAYLRSLASGEYITVASLPVCFSSADASREIEELQQQLAHIPARQSQIVALDRYGVFTKNPNCRHSLSALDALRLLREIRKRRAQTSAGSEGTSSPTSSQEPL